MHGIIYRVTNDINNLVYVGQTNYTLAHRWACHKSQCKNIFADENKFHAALNQLGIEHFIATVIEEYADISAEELDTREQYWISYYDSFYNGYNSTKGGKCGSRTYRTVQCYTLAGNLYKEYASAIDAAFDTDISPDAIIVCLNEEIQDSCGGFQWKYKDSNKTIKIFNINDKTLTGKKLVFIQYDLKGNYINHYLGIEEASKATNTHASGIARCANNEIKYSNNFIWRKEFRGEKILKQIQIPYINNTKRGISRKIIYINPNGEEQLYNSLSEAERETGYKRHKITYNCNIYPRSTLEQGGFKYA